MEFEKALELDLYHLDQSYLDLPKLTEEWNSKAIEAEISAMNAKNELDEAKSKLDQQIRESPSNFGFSKLTEDLIKSAIAVDPHIKAMNEDYFNLLSDHKRLKSKCASIATIEKSLQGLTKLFEAGYFASKPICAMEVATKTESKKLNTQSNINKIKNAKKDRC